MGAEATLSHHGSLYAQGGHSRPAHDETDRHGAGEYRLQRRKRRHGEVSYRYGADTDHHCHVRQLADLRRAAQWLSELPRAYLDGYGQEPVRFAQVCLLA